LIELNCLFMTPTNVSLIHTEWPKKCIHSLLINIFGINLNEISVSGWECNIMFSQQMAQALLALCAAITLNTLQNVVHAAVRQLWQCLDADGGHFEHLHWIQNSRTSLISILLLYKYSSYDYRVIFFISKCVYIILGHSVTQLSGMYCVLAVRINCINSLFGLASRKNSLHQVPHEISFLGLSVSIKEQMKFLKSLEKSILICLELFHC